MKMLQNLNKCNFGLIPIIDETSKNLYFYEDFLRIMY